MGQLFPDTPPIASISTLETVLRWTWRRACVEQVSFAWRELSGTLLVAPAYRIDTPSNESATVLNSEPERAWGGDPL